MELGRWFSWFVSTMLIVLVTTQLLHFADAGKVQSSIPKQQKNGGTHSIGVNYGRVGNNLPAPMDVIHLYRKCGIQSIRLFEPSPDVLMALRGSNLRVSLGARNEDLPNLANSQAAANAWVNTNVAPYQKSVRFDWITLGNEVIPGTFASNVVPAMKNIRNALNSIGLTTTKVTTVTAFILASSFPPSAGAFSEDTINVMKSVTEFLSSTGSPIMINVYPYFAFASNPKDISFDYAVLFNSKTPVVDGQYKYYSLFDAQVDAYNVALEKIGAGNVPIAIAETGWPTAGNNRNYTCIDNAKAYNHNLYNHVTSQGTPRKPSLIMDTFIFAMFNENQKSVGIEQNWGLFYPNQRAVYPLFANC